MENPQLLGEKNGKKGLEQEASCSLQCLIEQDTDYISLPASSPFWPTSLVTYIM